MDGGTWQRFLRSVDVLLTTYPDGSWRTAQPPQDFRLTEEEIVAVLEESEHYQRMGQITTFASVKSDLEKALAAKRERLERGEA